MTSDEAFLFRERTEVEEYVARNCYWDKNETRDRGRVSLQWPAPVHSVIVCICMPVADPEI